MSSVVCPRVASSRSPRIASAVGGVEVLAGLVEDEDIGSRRSSARAMASRWRWPPDSRAPFSPTSVCKAGGQRRRPSRRGGPGAARRRSRSAVASRLARRRFSSIVVSKMWASWATRPTTRPARRRRRGGRSRCRRARPWPSWSQEAHEHVGERRLARAAGADERDASARVPGRGRRRAARVRRRRGSARRQAAAGDRVRSARRRRERERGSVTGAGASVTCVHARGGAAHARERLGRGRQAGDELERDERDQREAGEQDAVERPRARRRRRRPASPTSPARSTASASPWPTPAVRAPDCAIRVSSGRRACTRCELGVGRRR